MSACNSNSKAPSSSSIVGKWKVNNIVIDNEATTQAEKDALSSFDEQMKMFKQVSEQMPLQLTFFEDKSFNIGAVMFKLPGTYTLSGDELTLEIKDAKIEANGKAQPVKLIVEQPDSKHLNLKVLKGKGALQLERVE